MLDLGYMLLNNKRRRAFYIIELKAAVFHSVIPKPAYASCFFHTENLPFVYNIFQSEKVDTLHLISNTTSKTIYWTCSPTALLVILSVLSTDYDN
jgi:hypothetical protein